MKVITLNLRHDVDRWNERLPLVVDVLAQENADVIAVQEVALTSPQAEQILTSLGAVGIEYTALIAPKWESVPKEGVAIFTRLPLLEYEHINLPHGGRVAQRIRVHSHGRIVNIANVHLHHHPRDDETIRVQQMRVTLDWMRKRDPGNWVFAGDFNAQPDSDTLGIAKQTFESAHFTVHGIEPVTHPTPLNPEREPGMRLSIDYILYDADVFRPVEAYRCADVSHPADSSLYPSDHYGVGARFAFLTT